MKYFFSVLSISLVFFFSYDILIKHDTLSDRYYMLIISIGSAIAWYITILIERKKQGPKT